MCPAIFSLKGFIVGSLSLIAILIFLQRFRAFRKTMENLSFSRLIFLIWITAVVTTIPAVLTMVCAHDIAKSNATVTPAVLPPHEQDWEVIGEPEQVRDTWKIIQFLFLYMMLVTASWLPFLLFVLLCRVVENSCD